MSDILTRFQGSFGQEGGDRRPGNTGEGRQLSRLCREALASSDSLLFDYYSAWHKRAGRTPVLFACALVQMGLWEAGWNVAQLHFDQTQKKEAADDVRRHKGDPLCGMALLGQVLNSHALVRHHAQLSSAGDVYWEHQDTDLVLGGLGATIMEAYESDLRHYRWREDVRRRMALIPKNEPRYLEPFLLMRWFGEAYWDLFLDAARVAGREGLPFTDVLLRLIAEPATAQRGKLFEAAAALLFSATPGFEVRSARRTTDEQIDFVVRYERDPLTVLPLAAGPGLVECKSSGEKIAVHELRDFGSKCQFHRVNFGVLVAAANITGGGDSVFSDPQYSELVRRRFLADGLAILVIDQSDLAGRARAMRRLQEPLAEDHDLLVFGPIDGAPPD